MKQKRLNQINRGATPTNRERRQIRFSVSQFRWIPRSGSNRRMNKARAARAKTARASRRANR